ncbi:hypothetical protein D0504_05485 [Weissella confusa]|uniref:hypothetical protein n=1 Tax=Weissella confusa TaxID=1583 RepID=UPI0021C01921|nr:hypothetical protein [Weissella confusa]MCT8393187.1 hypothetical protein [Weissella confusa]
MTKETDLFVVSKHSNATRDEKIAALKRLGLTEEQATFEHAVSKFNQQTKDRLVRLNTSVIEELFDLLSRTINESVAIPAIADDKKSFKQ